MTLRARIYLLVALAVAPAFALLIVDHHQDLQLRESEAEQQALRSTWLVSAELDQAFKGIETVLRAAGQTPIVSSFRVPDCTDYLARLEQVTPSAGSILAFDANGRMRCGTAGLAEAVTDRDYFLDAIKADGLVVGTYTIGRASGVPILPLALRVETSEGPGVLAFGLRLDWLRAHFAERFARLPPDSSLTIVDRNSTMLVRLPNPGREGKPLPDYDHVVKAPAPGTFRSAADKHTDGIARFLGFTPLDSPPQGVAIAVGHPQEPALAEVRASAMRNYVLLGLVALLAFLAAAVGERLFIRRPMSQLLSTIERWRNQDMTARVSHPSDRVAEFAQLGRAFNSMADELGAALKHKDVLLRELSHRVMNSLNTIGALFRLQVRSLDEPSAGAQFQQAISRIDAMALAYKRMQATQGVEAVEFASFLAELCKDLEASIMHGEAKCMVHADPVLLSPKQAIPLSLIVNELVTNAIKHGNRSEPVVVRLESSAERCRVAVRNCGVLREGYEGAGKGFGLKMISAMVTQLHGKLEVTSSGGETEFGVTFPPEPPTPSMYASGERHGGPETKGSDPRA